MHLYFDEIILASSFKANGLTLESLDHSCFDYSTQGRVESSCTSQDWAIYQSWTLSRTQTLYVGPDSTELVFRLSEYDLNAIKVSAITAGSLILNIIRHVSPPTTLSLSLSLRLSPSWPNLRTAPI